ncbi:MAG: glycosyltransferase [Candidatus Abyssobacteria bacterium SURF_5]|uniref:Glycosyltransferase n=1 Tax=Abyssobacteria bacterium (strain SURF_5) TaxID=2093360 RepID=A0A3A4NEG1_ABYX5|nr:MAG: glycosyltransferase [Candidatus Abyssubacteria bacterium SURF_5]
MYRNRLPRKLKVALYSHDSQGLGHVRRNLCITQAFSRCDPSPSTLLIVGAREAALFSTPRGVDFLSLPAISKENDGKYASRSLDMPLEKISELRANTIRSVLDLFSPDVFVIDKHPTGILGELEKTLELLREKGGTRCVLGLRDVLDHPSAVWKEWHRLGTDAVVSSFFDEVWVYSDPTIYDPISECRICQDINVPIRYTGYLGRKHELDAHTKGLNGLNKPPGVPAGRFVLCMVGGGQDGFKVAEAFANAELPDDTHAVLVTGPFMSADKKRKLGRASENNRRLTVFEFYKWPELLLQAAWKVVSMGGYNTVIEMLSLRKNGLIVPRVKPRSEQLIRAERLQKLGLLDMVHPDKLTPAALSRWFASDVVERPFARIDLMGTQRISGFLARLVSKNPVAESRSAGVAEYGII